MYRTDPIDLKVLGYLWSNTLWSINVFEQRILPNSVGARARVSVYIGVVQPGTRVSRKTNTMFVKKSSDSVKGKKIN